MKQSIFSKSRFEHDGAHLYYLDSKRLRLLEGDSQVLIHGSRGTGKTTLLNSLNWVEQFKNQSLMNALTSEKYKTEYLGVYVKIPKINIDSFSKWEEENCNVYSQVFSFFLDLAWLEPLLSALSELSAENKIDITAKTEREVCEDVLRTYPVLADETEFLSNNVGFADLSALFKTSREQVERASLYGESVISVHEKFKISGQAGEFGRRVAKIIHLAFDKMSLAEYKFKICLDECECLSNYQVKILSTITRLSEHPTFFVFSFISMPDDFHSTLSNNLSNQKADLEFISLDEMSDAEFEKFAEGVVNVRLDSIAESRKVKFRSKQTLGDLNINKLIDRIISKSESKEAKKFYNAAKNMSNHPFYSYYEKQQIPFFQVYLADKLEINIDEFCDDWKKARRSFESQVSRKKMVAAYLSICHDYKLTPLYASSQMVFQISDKSIRDYLWQLHEVYIEFGKAIEDFVSSEIPIDIQDKALKRASLQKIKSLPSSPLTAPGKIYRIVSGLAQLTSLIQKTSSDGAHLRSPERGRFKLSVSGAKTEGVVGLIHEAAEAGFMKVIQVDQGFIVFRVHTSLSPHFSFSYRGAYYETAILCQNLEDLRDTDKGDELSERVRALASSIYNIGSGQLHMEGF